MSFYKNNYNNFQNEQEFPLNNYFQNPNINSYNKTNNTLLNSQNTNNIFNFKQPTKQRFLWKDLMKINTNFIRQTKDITPLEPYLDNLLSSSLQEGEVNILPEEYISHLIEILQIIGEYLFYIQKRLEDENGGLKSQFNQTLSKIKENNNNEKDNIINELKKENKEKDLLLITYQKILKESQSIGNKNNLIDDSDNDDEESNLKNKKEAFYCQFCSGKKFKSEKYLEEHMKRRHLIEYQSNKNPNKKNNNMDDKLNEMKEYFENLIRENQIRGDYNRLNDRLDNIQNMLYNSKFIPQNYPTSVNNNNSLNRNDSIPNKQSIYVEKTSIEKLRTSNRPNNFNENSQKSIKNIPINKSRNSEIKISASLSQRNNSNEPNNRYNNSQFYSKFNEPQIKQQVFSERQNLKSSNDNNNDSINPNIQKLNFNKNQRPKQYQNQIIENTITTKKVIENTEIINNKMENDNTNQVNNEPEIIMNPKQNELFISQNPNQELPEFGKNNNENIQIENSQINNNLQNQDNIKLKSGPSNKLITKKYEILNEKKEEYNYSEDPRLALDLFYKRFHERDNAIRGESFDEYFERTIPTSFNIDQNQIDYEINQLIDQDLKKNSNNPNLNQYNLIHLNKDQIFELITNSFNNIEKDANSNEFYQAYNNNINYTVNMTNEIHEADEYYHGLKNEENLKKEKKFYINSNNNINKQINNNNYNNNNNFEMNSNNSNFSQNKSNNNSNFENISNNNKFINNNSNIIQSNINNNNNINKNMNISNNNNSKVSNNNINEENDEFDYE